jgi:hypothetical protein
MFAMRLGDANDRDGEAVEIESTPRLTDTQIRRTRDLWMLRLHGQGYQVDTIAKLFNRDRDHVCRLLRRVREVASIAG